ncbi:MAG: class I SAM-dependent methyltransferase [Deltaproteobacteria bacterium]|nr:class I SAM-dependent methyltransferase [Deltaproteobacteria bacterium]
MRTDLHEKNRQSWNEATRAHNSHKGDQGAFFRGGGSTLFPEELDLLGEVKGTHLVHLLCNSGQDSLSLAALGAQVTGVDISDEAISFARQLSSDSGIAASFHRSDVFDWLAARDADSPRFDLAFSSYGAIGWLSDLQAWMRGVAATLVPGGRLVIVEFHPFAFQFDPQWKLKYDYFGGSPMLEEGGVDDYVAESGDGLWPQGTTEGVRGFSNPHPTYEFQWSLSEIFASLLAADLTLERFQEYPYSNGWRGFEGMREGADRRFYAPEELPKLPLMFGLSARKGTS